MGVEADSAGGIASATAAGTAALPDSHDRRNRNPMDSSPAETFAASRWTQGNFFFPTRLVISPQRVARVKSRLFGSNEESISMSKIASVHISTGVFWSEIVIESTGGTDPITSHGHRKADAQRIRDLIEKYQAQARV